VLGRWKFGFFFLTSAKPKAEGPSEKRIQTGNGVGFVLQTSAKPKAEEPSEKRIQTGAAAQLQKSNVD